MHRRDIMSPRIMQAPAFDAARGRGYDRPMSTWHVYLLRCADSTLYCGITNDLERRLAQHNAGTAAKYTRSRTPVRLEASVSVPSKGDALRLEMRVKRQKRERKAEFLLAWAADDPA